MFSRTTSSRIPFSSHTVRLVAILCAIVLPTAGASSATAKPRSSSVTKPTIVLVHGGFADASGFAAVTERLQRAGYPVIAPAVPLRTLSGDAAYVASVLRTIKGPIVLVGHSYGGAVTTEASTLAPNVKALVYLNAFALKQGESAKDISDRFTDSLLGPALLPRPFPLPDGTTGTDFYIDPAQFPKVFAGDLPESEAARIATAQRPLTLAAFTEAATAPGWATIPSWYLVGRQDRAIDPAAERFMAKRAGSHTIEVNSSHASYASHPGIVTKLIERAAEATG